MNLAINIVGLVEERAGRVPGTDIKLPVRNYSASEALVRRLVACPNRYRIYASDTGKLINAKNVDSFFQNDSEPVVSEVPVETPVIAEEEVVEEPTEFIDEEVEAFNVLLNEDESI